jgi:hypothetical protein
VQTHRVFDRDVATVGAPGNGAGARKLHEEAIRIGEAALGRDHSQVAQGLARALWEQGSDRRRAVELATQAAYDG